MHAMSFNLLFGNFYSYNIFAGEIYICTTINADNNFGNIGCGLIFHVVLPLGYTLQAVRAFLSLFRFNLLCC